MTKIVTFKKSIAAGMVIAIGSTVYLSCESKLWGAVLFCVGLYTICTLSLNLFTGKIGYALDNKSFASCILIWLGNFLGSAVISLPVRIIKPNIAESAAKLVQAKLQMPLLHVAGLSVCCGILMYIAVEIYRSQTNGFSSSLGILLAVPTFILCGFEHSIADMCYFFMGLTNHTMILSSLLFILVCSVCNGLGSMLFRILTVNKKK